MARTDRDVGEPLWVPRAGTRPSPTVRTDFADQVHRSADMLAYLRQRAPSNRLLRVAKHILKNLLLGAGAGRPYGGALSKFFHYLLMDPSNPFRPWCCALGFVAPEGRDRGAGLILMVVRVPEATRPDEATGTCSVASASRGLHCPSEHTLRTVPLTRREHSTRSPATDRRHLPASR